MMRTRQSRLAVVALAATFLAAVPVVGSAGLTINWTPSMPQGFYWASHRQPAKGELAQVCPPDTAAFQLAQQRGYLQAGRCPTGLEPMVKRFLAAKGDHVQVSAAGVTINGVLLPGSAPLARDSKGRPMPQLRINRVLSEGEVFLMTNSPRSYDGRYTGPVPASALVATMRPVVTL